MKLIRLINRTHSAVLCPRCAVADRFWTRVRGLQFRAPLAPDEGLLITSCPSVHMIGVRFAIDVIFLTRENIVTDWVEDLPPGFHFYVAKPRADANGASFGKPFAALELPAGAVAKNDVRLGDEIAVEHLTP